MNWSKRISLIAIFAAIAAILDSIPGIPQFESGVWYSWIFLIEPIMGYILGPFDGFFSMLIGVLVGHYIYFRGPYEFLFTLGAPMGTMMAGLLFQKRNRLPILFYASFLTLYFLTPISKNLPLWGMWNVYLAFIILLTIAIMRVKKARVLICSFIGLEADILFRIFLFVPMQTYRIFYGFALETMRLIWMAGAFITPVQVGISLIFTAILYSILNRIVKFSKETFR